VLLCARAREGGPPIGVTRVGRMEGMGKNRKRDHVRVLPRVLLRVRASKNIEGLKPGVLIDRVSSSSSFVEPRSIHRTKKEGYEKDGKKVEGG